MIVRLIVRRIFFLVFVLFGLSLVTFTLTRIVPGDPARQMAGPRARPATIEKLREQYGLNDPAPVQYFNYVKGVIRLDFGESFSTRLPVRDDLGTRLPATIELALYAFLLATIIGVPLGVASAVKRDSIIDNVSRFVSISGVALPVFWLALLLQFLIYAKLGWLPDGLRFPIEDEPPPEVTSLYTVDALIAGDLGLFWTAVKHLVMPVTVLAYGSLAVITRMVRGGMIEVLNQDYIRTARAKGLAGNTIVIRHALKNALLPTVTSLGLQIGLLLSGAVLVELVFSWPGIGRYAVQGILQTDYNATMATTLIISAIFVFVNLFVDIIYLFLDPRIEYA